jgi:hypothetical protein
MLEQILQSIDIENGGNISKDMKNNLQNEQNMEDSKQFLSILKSKMEGTEKGNKDGFKSENFNLENISMDDNNPKLGLSLLQNINMKVKVLEENSSKNQILVLSTKAQNNLKNVLSEISTQKEFSNVKSLEDLVNLAKKYKLNLETLTVEDLTNKMKADKAFDKKSPMNLEQLLTEVKKENKSQKREIKQTQTEVLNNTKQTKQTQTEVLNNTKQTKQTQTEVLTNIKQTQTEVLTNIKQTQTEILNNIKKEQANINTNDVLNMKNNLQDNSQVNSNSLINQKQNVKNPDLNSDIEKLKQEIFAEDNNQQPIKNNNKVVKDNKSDLNSFLNGIVSSAKKDIEEKVLKNKITEDVLKDKTKEKIEIDNFNSKKILETKVESLNVKTITNNQLLNQTVIQRNEFSLSSILSKFETKDKAVKDIKSSLNLDDPMMALQKESQRANMMSNEIQINQEQLGLRVDNYKNDMNINFQNKISQAKETLNKLAEDLKEKLKEYKPPIMKMQLQLKPMNLGNIDVTVLSRGGSLQLQMNASSQVLQMFANHANDLKDALNNIGFNDVQMNFNSNSDNSGNSSNNQDNQPSEDSFMYGERKKAKESKDSLDGTQIANSSSEISSMEIILPQYA